MREKKIQLPVAVVLEIVQAWYFQLLPDYCYGVSLLAGLIVPTKILGIFFKAAGKGSSKGL